MKIAILGAGFTGLTAAYYLAKKGHQVHVFEKENQAGGLARGFKLPGWTWSLEENYHHFFASDRHVFDLIKDLGLENKLFFKKPITAVYYRPDNKEQRTKNRRHSEFISESEEKQTLKQVQGDEKYATTKQNSQLDNLKIRNFGVYPLDTPFNFLLFPHLSPIDKIRSGLALTYLKATPFWRHLEKITAKDWIIQNMGLKTWQILWQPLFLNKFGSKQADKIPASWFWARIKKRSQKLGYLKGGFQVLANKLVKEIKNLGGKFYFGYQVKKINLTKKAQKFTLQPKKQPKKPKKCKSRAYDRTQNIYISNNYGLDGIFDKIVATLPTPVFSRIARNSKLSNYIKSLSSIKHLYALTLVLTLKKPFLKNTYWLNICDPSFPFLLLVQHTNFIEPKYYAGQHILYIGNYLPDGHPYLKKGKEELLEIFLPYLKKLNPSLDATRDTKHVTRFASKYAQPVFPLNYSKIKPGLATPLPGLFLANQDQVYPWDRGVNYAVGLGKKVADLVEI